VSAINVTTQEELDNALADLQDGDWIECRGGTDDSPLKVRGSSTVWAYDSSTVWAYDSSTVTDDRVQPEAVEEETLTESAHAHEAQARRHAAALLDAMGTPSSYDDAVTLAAVAYLDGGKAQLKWARDLVTGEGE